MYNGLTKEQRWTEMQESLGWAIKITADVVYDLKGEDEKELTRIHNDLVKMRLKLRQQAGLPI
jgi:hypothetical protein